MLRNLTDKLGANLPLTTHAKYMVKLARLDDGIPEFLELKASPVEGRSLQRKNAIKRGASGKKGLSRLKISKNSRSQEVN